LKGGEYMLYFIVGFVVGSIIGVLLMCLLRMTEWKQRKV